MSVFPGSSAKKSGRPLARQTRELREAIVALTDDYDVMTVRQVFYALVSRGIVPKEETRGYRPVQRQVLDLRKAGLLPWQFISDSTRWMRKPETWDTVEDAMSMLARTYRRDLWRSQHLRIEVWLEKDALASVISPVTSGWDVALMVSRGISSATFLHSSVEQANEAGKHGIGTQLFTLFDFDAGGARACRAISDYFGTYCTAAWGLKSLAVSAEQIDEWDLPTRPAKSSDPEAHKWGERAVELDAIPPDQLAEIVDSEIRALIDPAAWNAELAYEKSEREILERMVAS